MTDRGPVPTAPAGPLLERERELTAILQALAAARQGRGALVLVEGPAGIGKTRLLGAGREEAGTHGMQLLHGRGLQLEREVPFGVAVELFAPPLTAASDEERDQFLTGHAGLARALLGSATPFSGDPQALVRGLFWLTVNLVTRPASHSGDRRHPLVIAVDDAQWVDRPSMAFLAHLAARLDGLAVALLVSLRSEEPTATADLLRSLRETSGCAVVSPAPLSEPAVGRLVADELGDTDPAFAVACAHVTGGIPFMVRELARALHSDGISPTADSVARVERLVPASVLQSVLARLGRLSDASRRLATALAVLGDRVPLRYARLLGKLEPGEAEEAADALARAGILGAGEPLRFSHPLIATAIYSDLAAFARARAHRDAAALLAADGAPVEEIAAHLLLTRPDGDIWTVEVLRGAASRALAHGDPEAGARMLRRALDEPPPRPLRPSVLLDLAEAEARGGARAAEAHVAEALGFLDEPEDRRRALRTLSRVKLALGDHAAASVAMEEVLDRLDSSDATYERMLAEYLTVSSFRTGLYLDAAARLDPIVEGARHGASPDDPALLAHLALRLALVGEPADRIRPMALRATAEEPLVNPDTYGMPMGMLVQALCAVDELEVAEQIADAALSDARQRGSLIAASLASYHRAIPRYHRGALADALADLDQARGSSEEGFTSGLGWTRALQAHAHLERGDRAAAREAIWLGPLPPPEAMDRAIVLFARARLALADRDAAAALTDAMAAGRQLDEGFGIDHPGFLPWRSTAALAAAAVGEGDRARRLADQELERARSCGVPRAIGLSLRTASALADGERRIELLSEAASVLAVSPSVLERAHTLAALGGAHRRTGHRSNALTTLRQALELADGLGATALAEAVRDELRTLGARPRRAALTGVDALTPAERRVAQLASAGLTNPQIAQDLFVTTKTVQTHLAHTYRKLGVTSRRQLASVLTDTANP